MPGRCFKCLLPITEADPQKYGIHLRCFTAWFDAQPTDEFNSFVLRSNSKAPDKETVNSDTSSFFHGQYRKYSAALAGKNYILKVKQDGAPELPDVEFMCNQIAEKLGIPVARYYCIELGDERAFVTQNFIDKSEHANLSHIHTHLPEGRKADCEALIEVISSVTERYIDIETFVRTCLFDSLIGNHDRHGRNLGFIVTPRGSRLSPIYDNPSVLGIHQGWWLTTDFAPSGRVPTSKSKDPSMVDYVKEFVRLGYVEQVEAFAAIAIKEVIHPIIDRSFCSEEMKTAMKKLIEKRIKELQDALVQKSS